VKKNSPKTVMKRREVSQERENEENKMRKGWSKLTSFWE